MRSTNEPADRLPTLGAPIRPATPPTPSPIKTETPGVLRGADGRVHTDLPEPSWAAPSCLADKPAEPAEGAWIGLDFGREVCAACGSTLTALCAVSLCGNLDCRG